MSSDLIEQMKRIMFDRPQPNHQNVVISRTVWDAMTACAEAQQATIARLESLVRGLSTDCKCSDACEDGDCDYCMARSNAKEVRREQ